MASHVAALLLILALAPASPAAATTPLSIAIVGDRSMSYGMSANLAAEVRDPSGTPLAGVQMNLFVRDAQQLTNVIFGCQTLTDGSGVAACVAGDDLLRAAPGGYALHVFPNQGDYSGSATVGFAVYGTPTALTYTGPTTFTVGQPALLSAVLRATTRAFSTAGEVVAFETGPLEAAMPGCQGVVDGHVSCTLAFDRAGSLTLTVDYAGSRPFVHPFFLPARIQVPVVVVAPLPTTASDCKAGGWQGYGGFKNQGDCVSFVATEGRNQPAR